MAAESTAINALINLIGGRKLDEDEDPVPELFSMAPPKSVPQRTVGMQAQPQPMAASTPPRTASGTKPPAIGGAAIGVVSIAPPAPSIPAPVVAAAVSRKVVYRAAPVVEHDDEQTELWNSKSELDTAPAVPAIAPHIATVIAQTATAPVVPSILRGPVAPGPDPRIMQAARAAHEAAQQRSIDPRVDAAAAARHAAAKAQPRAQLPAIAHPVSLPRQQSQGVQYPAIKMTVAMAETPRTPTAPPASYLVARELLSSAMRWGGLAVIAVIALSVGAYLAFASKGDDKPEAPTDRDRAIAIMNGTAQPDPEPTVVKAPPEVSTAYKPAEPEAKPAAPEAKPEPTAEPIEAPAATDAPADEEIDMADIELEPATTTKPAKRAARSSRGARKAKAIGTTEPKIASPARTGSDPVLAILAEKPKQITKPVIEKPKKKEKPVKEASLASATEIAAPRGAAAAKGNGKLSISSDKPALIYVDGRPTGKSAPSAFVITAGDHQITLLDPSTKKAKTATVQIAVNKTVSIRKDFN